jgi:hypothetical protein
MDIGRFTFTCCFESEAVLPVFKGSTLRGGLGHALKRATCALRQQECRSCLLRESCAYGFLFEQKGVSPSSSGATGPASRRPPPYILIPPDDTHRHYRAEDQLVFDVLLLGHALNYLPHLVVAVTEMGTGGIGKGSRRGEGRFRLDSVRQDGEVIYHGDTLNGGLAPRQLHLERPPEGTIGTLALLCRTPLRLKQDNHLQAELPFHRLIRAALRRISSLEAAYGNSGEPSLDYRGLVARAKNVHISSSTCRWQEIERYSNRQKSTMLMGGITGRVTYQGDDLSEFVPLLRYCETVHLGKQTSFGLGRITLQIGDEQ